MARISRDHISQFYEQHIDLSTKTLYLGYGTEGEDVGLDDRLAADILKGLHLLSSIRPEDPLTIMMNCEGGSTQHGLAIYDKIRSLSCPVTIDVWGHCYSMAAWILQSGDLRRMSRHSSLMIHNGETEIGGGNNSEVDSWYRFGKRQDNLCVDILLARIREKHPKFQRARLKRMLSTDTILMPSEALQLGLIDEVIE